MEIPALFVELGIELEKTDFLKGWKESVATSPGTGWECLTPDYISNWCDRLTMNTEPKAALIDGLKLFSDRPELIPLAWHGQRLLTLAGETGTRTTDGFPNFDTTLHPCAPLLHAYCFLAAAPELRRTHETRGIPEDVTHATLNDIEIWLKTAHERDGVWGCNKMYWLVNHFSATLYRLGRLQFEIRPHSGPYRAYRHRTSGETQVVAAKEMIFRQDGQANGCNGIKDPEAWASTFQEAEGGLTATSIHPHGHALPDPISLDLGEWERILEEGDTCLSVHIQADGGMGHGDCADSFAAALPFFAKHFPELTIKAFTCTSWLLDNQFDTMLKPTSNIVRFLREWYLAPNPSGSDAQTLDRVFHGPINNLDDAPQHSSLQHAIVEHMRSGKRCRDSAAFFFPQDLPWGREVYRRDS
ncbi:MAG: acyltransferase domain-containing protein [Planctomycetota bacterium]|jgi:hypothetical protein